MRKIAFVLPALNAGGAEKIVCDLINFLDRDYFEIFLVLLQKKGRLINRIPLDIEVVDLKKESLRSGFWDIKNSLKKISPNIVFSSIGSMNLLIASLRRFFPKKMKFIARETNIVSLKNRDEKYPRLFDLMFKTVYRNFDLVIAQSKDMKEDLILNFNVPLEKIKVINNPVDIKKISKLAESEKSFLKKGVFNLLAVGSLSRKKGFDRLLEAFSLIEDEDIFLTIVGEGKEREKLIDFAKALGLKERVDFRGFLENPYPLMKEADLFALTSRYEGFANVLLESLACETPILAYGCKGGVNEIVIEGVNGWIVRNGDREEFAKKIKEAKNYPFDRWKIKKSAYRYEFSKIMRVYQETLRSI